MADKTSVATGGDASELSMMLTQIMAQIDKNIDTFQKALIGLDSKVEAMALKEGIGSALKVKSLFLFTKFLVRVL